MSKPTPNADQSTALKKIYSFLLSDDKEFFLTGSPGVGKTFITAEMVATIPQKISEFLTMMGEENTFPYEIVLTSTTNTASAVLQTQVGRKASTIHSFLKLRIINDFDTGTSTVAKTKNWMVHSNVILIMDEAPMAGSKLYQLIQEGFDSSCKIIYIGDQNQLAPVKEKLSPVCKLAGTDQSYEITTPVRNSNSPALMDLCNRLRSDIVNKTSRDFLTHWDAVQDQITHINGDEFQQLITDSYGPNGTVDTTADTLSGRILCYTNKRVLDYNKYIRGIKGLPDHPVQGENLISNTHYSLGRGKAPVNVEDQVHIHDIDTKPQTLAIDMYNSLEVRVAEVSSRLTSRFEVNLPVDMDAYRNLIRHYAKKKDWPTYFNLKEKFMDLRDREASTVYKAQGSSYDFVIMDMDDIFSSRDIDQLRRMLYVGGSRSKQRVYVYDLGIHTGESRFSK